MPDMLQSALRSHNQGDYCIYEPHHPTTASSQIQPAAHSKTLFPSYTHFRHPVEDHLLTVRSMLFNISLAWRAHSIPYFRRRPYDPIKKMLEHSRTKRSSSSNHDDKCFKLWSFGVNSPALIKQSNATMVPTCASNPPIFRSKFANSQTQNVVTGIMHHQQGFSRFIASLPYLRSLA